MEETGRRSGWPLLRNLRDRIKHALDGGVWSPPKVRGARLFTTHQPACTDHARLLVIEADLARVLVDVLAVDPDGTTARSCMCRVGGGTPCGALADGPCTSRLASPEPPA